MDQDDVADLLGLNYVDPDEQGEIEALHRLIGIAQSDTGQSRRVANFLLAWWNAGTCGGFDLTDLWCIDTAIRADILKIMGLIARVHEYPDMQISRNIFVGLVAQWRPHLVS